MNDIGGFYSASNADIFNEKVAILKYKFHRIESRLSKEAYFEGCRFSLVDAVFGPVFRYFDVFDQIDEFSILKNNSKILNWRSVLSERNSVKEAVTEDYEALLFSFLRNRNSYLSKLIS